MSRSHWQYLIALLFATEVAAAYYPVEFTDYFAPKRSLVQVFLAGEMASQRVDAEVTYESFRLLSSDSGPDALRGYLRERQLTEEAVERIVQALVAGVPANPGCEVELADCRPWVAGEQVGYVFDIDQERLTIFVGSRLLHGPAEGVQYHSAARASSALINQARLYGYSSESLKAGLTASNLTTLGLPYGFMQLSSQYNNASNQFDVYRGGYELEVGGTRAVLGFQERERVQFNSTDFLMNNINYAAWTAQVGSSRNLVKGGESSLHTVEFFAPQAGQLEIYQGDRLLLTKVVEQGRLSIPYDELPGGAYEIRIVLKTGNTPVVEERRQIVNSWSFNVPVGGWDYVLTGGQLRDIPEQRQLRWQRGPERVSTGFGQARAAWRVSDRVMVAGALSGNQDDGYGQLGAKVMWSDGLYGDYQGGIFSSRDVYHSASLNLGPFSLYASNFESDGSNRQYRLSSVFYGEQSYFNYGASYSFALLDGSGYVNYARYESDYPWAGDTLRQSKGDTVTTGWTRSLWGGLLSLNSNYYHQLDGRKGDLSVGVYWSYSLGSDWRTQLGVFGTPQGVTRAESGVTHSARGERWNSSATATAAWVEHGKSEAAFAGSLAGETDWFDASAYGSVNNNGQRMVSGTLSGSQFISAEGAGLTRLSGTSFINVVPDTSRMAGEPVMLEDIGYNVRVNRRGISRGDLGDNNAVIALTPYTEAEFVLDGDTSGVNVVAPARTEFAQPGTVFTVDAKLTSTMSRLFVLRDLQGQPVTNAYCVGEGCVSVEPLSEDGVFRVNYRQGGDIKLMSRKQVCLFNAQVAHQQIVHTYCLPGLDEKEPRVALSDKVRATEGDLLYLGKYPADNYARGMLDKLKGAGLATRSVELGNYLYIYVAYSQQYTLTQRALLEGMEVYIVANEAELNRLFSTR